MRESHSSGGDDLEFTEIVIDVMRRGVLKEVAQEVHNDESG